MRSCAEPSVCGDVRLRANSGTNLGDLAERANSGTNPGDLAERVNSGTNPEDSAERTNSGTNPGDSTERANSGTNLGDLNPEDLAEWIHSGSNPGDLAERANSGINLGDLAERMHSGSNPGDLAKRAHTWVGMTFSDSSSIVRVVSSPRSGEASRCDLEVGSSGASSGPPSPVDTRVLRDLEVMKADHDLDTTVTEGSLAVIRERYSIPVEYGLHVPQPGQRPYSSDAPDMCISVDALESGRLLSHRPSQFSSQRAAFQQQRLEIPLPFVSGPIWGFMLDWSAHPIGNAYPYLSEEESVLVGRLKEILSSSCAIKEMTELWLVEAGLSPASRDRMDLSDLRGMPKVSSSKAPPARLATREVGASPTREAPKASSKRPVDAPIVQVDDPTRRHKKVKVLTRRHKSRLGEGESRSRSKGKEPVAPSEEPDMPTESEEGGASPVHRRRRSMKDLFKTKVHKDDAGYYTLQMSDLGHQDPDKEMKAR
ncbi:hypothetical protein GW17_00056672 [Ensete ventricosum]|nr:hypothetical protein GW17_00056672 [Ensete ventricosum]